jgi:hypothetical protein
VNSVCCHLQYSTCSTFDGNAFDGSGIGSKGICMGQGNIITCTRGFAGTVCSDAELPGYTGGSGDPQYTGFLGQSFQCHGIDGMIYALLSSY